MRADEAELWRPIDGVDRQAESIGLVVDRQLQRRIDIAFFLIPAHVDPILMAAAICQSMDQRRISVEVEDDGLVRCEQGIEIGVFQAMWMLTDGLQPKQIDDIDKSDFDVGKGLPQKRRRRKSLLCGDIAGRRHHDVRFTVLVVTGPGPYAEPFRAVLDGGVHIQILQVHLLVRNDDIDVVAASEAVVRDREQTVGVGGQVDARHFRALVRHNVDKARVLVSKSVVILAPDRRRDQQIQRCDLPAPGESIANRQPLGVLIEHRVDHMHEGLIGRNEPVTAGKQVSLQHALYGVLAEHLHHSSVGRQFPSVRIFRKGCGEPNLLARFIKRVQLVRGSFIRTENAKILRVSFHYVAKEAPQGRRILGLGAARSGDCRSIFPEVRQPQRLVQNPAIRMGARAHAPCACGSKLFQLRDEPALFIEQLFGFLRAHPTLQKLELRGILFYVS